MEKAQKQLEGVAFSQVLEITMPLTFALPLLVLKDHYKFSRQKLKNFMSYEGTLLMDFQEERFTYKELLDVIKDEGGIDLVDAYTEEWDRKYLGMERRYLEWKRRDSRERRKRK